MSDLQHISLTLAAPSDAGALSLLCQTLGTHHGTITEAKIGAVAGIMSGVVRIRIPRAHANAFYEGLKPLQEVASYCRIHGGEAALERPMRMFVLTYRGGDRPGLLESLGTALRQNACDYTSIRIDSVEEGGLSDYILSCELGAPRHMTRQQLENVVASIGNRFGVDLVLFPADLDDLLP